LSAVGYDAHAAVLVVSFRSGSTYEYYKIPALIYERLLRAGSHGKFFHTHIRNSFRYRRVN
jgi:hypothetical protein